MEIYEQLRDEAVAGFRRNEARIDSRLSAKETDSRRGLTLLWRPPLSVRAEIGHYLEQLTRAFPDQYFYHPDEFHVTILSIVSGTEQWRKEIRLLPAYRTIIRDVVCACRPFEIRFAGVTASPAAVMIQGFPAGDGLETIRHRLRETFRAKGFADLLDRRYAVRAAHMTVMRFCRPANWAGLVPLLEQGRRLEFGTGRVEELQLVFGDWYASRGVTRTMARYSLVSSG